MMIVNHSILLLAGTSDARELAIDLQQAGYQVLATVVTDNAAQSLEKAGIKASVGRLEAEEIAGMIRSNGISALVDASHPFAEEASRNAILGAQIAEVPYIRYERFQHEYEQSEHVTVVADYEEAAELAAERKGNILLTTGSKTLHIFAKKLIGLPDTRVIARMLPRKDNMEKCEQLGIEQKNIIAMQGPFTKNLNKALYEQFQVTLMITKESGKQGAVDEKLEAALEMGIDTILIGRPKISYPNQYSCYEEILNHLNQLFQGGTCDGFSY